MCISIHYILFLLSLDSYNIFLHHSFIITHFHQVHNNSPFTFAKSLHTRLTHINYHILQIISSFLVSLTEKDYSFTFNKFQPLLYIHSPFLSSLSSQFPLYSFPSLWKIQKTIIHSIHEYLFLFPVFSSIFTFLVFRLAFSFFEIPHGNSTNLSRISLITANSRLSYQHKIFFHFNSWNKSL